MQEDTATYAGMVVIGAPIALIAVAGHTAWTGGTTLATMMAVIGALALSRNLVQPRQDLPRARIRPRKR